MAHKTSSRLEKYGITNEMRLEALASGKQWCFWHKKFEDSDLFREGRRLCRQGDVEQTRGQYEKHGNTRRHHAPKGLYKNTMEKQDGHCALCPSTGNGRKLVLDHDHACCDSTYSCGKCLRGLLCQGCNVRLGHLEFFLREALVLPKAGTLKTLGHPETWTALALHYLQSYRKDSE